MIYIILEKAADLLLFVLVVAVAVAVAVAVTVLASTYSTVTYRAKAQGFLDSVPLRVRQCFELGECSRRSRRTSTNVSTRPVCLRIQMTFLLVIVKIGVRKSLPRPRKAN